MHNRMFVAQVCLRARNFKYRPQISKKQTWSQPVAQQQILAEHKLQKPSTVSGAFQPLNNICSFFFLQKDKVKRGMA